MTSEQKITVLLIAFVTVRVMSISGTVMVKNYFAYETAKIKAAEGHKFKFGITKEDNNEVK